MNTQQAILATLVHFFETNPFNNAPSESTNHLETLSQVLTNQLNTNTFERSLKHLKSHIKKCGDSKEKLKESIAVIQDEVNVYLNLMNDDIAEKQATIDEIKIELSKQEELFEETHKSHRQCLKIERLISAYGYPTDENLRDTIKTLDTLKWATKELIAKLIDEIEPPQSDLDKIKSTHQVLSEAATQMILDIESIINLNQ